MKDTVSLGGSISLIGVDGYQTYKIDECTIGVRPEWISCKDKLPQPDYTTHYLVYGIPTCGGACEKKWDILFCRYEKERGFLFGEYDCSCEASHWMPLPKLPNEEK